MSLTINSHFWNEEFLQPYWLRHHYALGDHGVLIDYSSMDGSLAFIKEFASRWEVRPSRNEFFGASEVDREVIETEQEFSGWKIVLNTTEFLLCPDLYVFLRWKEEYRPDLQVIWPFDFVMIDPLDEREYPVSEAPLHFQKDWGYYSGGSRSRLLHRLQEGRMPAGTRIRWCPRFSMTASSSCGFVGAQCGT